MTRIIVERFFDSPLSDADLQAIAERESCSELYGVTVVRSYIGADCQTAICVYDAPDAEAVRMVQRIDGMPFHKIYPADEITVASGSMDTGAEGVTQESAVAEP